MFYENVRDLCALHRTNITQLAKDLGWSSSLPTKWKKGAVPKADTIQAIADHFGVTTDYLLGPSKHNQLFGDIHESSVAIGNMGRSINVHSGACSLTGEENELLRIFRSLNYRERVELMKLAFDLEDRSIGGENDA